MSFLESCSLMENSKLTHGVSNQFSQKETLTSALSVFLDVGSAESLWVEIKLPVALWNLQI